MKKVLRSSSLSSVSLESVIFTIITFFVLRLKEFLLMNIKNSRLLSSVQSKRKGMMVHA